MYPPCRSRALWWTLVAAVLLAGCGGGGMGDIQRAADQGDYREVIALCRHALRAGDDRPQVHYYYGVGLVGVGRDREGFAEFDRAVADDEKFAPRASRFLWDQALTRPGSVAAAQRMRKASMLDPDLDLGRYRFAVADASLAERDYARAAALYEGAIKAYPDTAACEPALAHLSECYAEMNEPDKARAAMETLVRKYPRGSLAGRAAARLDDVALGRAQQAYDDGDYAKAAELAGELVETTANRSLQQKARFLLGESREATGDVAGAYAAYNEILRSDRGDPGRVVERARARIEALQEAGLK